MGKREHMSENVKKNANSIVELVDHYEALSGLVVKIAEAAGVYFDGAPVVPIVSGDLHGELVQLAEATANRVEMLRDLAAALPTHGDLDYVCDCGEALVLLPHFGCSHFQDNARLLLPDLVAAEGS